MLLKVSALGDGLFWTDSWKSKGRIPLLFTVKLQCHEISMGESAKVPECEKRVRCIVAFILDNWSRITAVMGPISSISN
jgi:hypothetical protein